MVARDFTETVNTAEGGGAVISKLYGRLCIDTGEMNLGGR